MKFEEFDLQRFSAIMRLAFLELRMDQRRHIRAMTLSHEAYDAIRDSLEKSDVGDVSGAIKFCGILLVRSE